MKTLFLTVAVALSVSAAYAAPPVSAARISLTGDYVEARTASVFAGPCHYNGELTTTGREAEMAWHVREGQWNGTSLSGLSAVATLVSEANLQDEQAERRSVLFIDEKATGAQAEALTAALKAGYGKALGKVVAVKRAPITFERKAEAYRVEAKGVTHLRVQSMPNHECCKEPSLVWYKPLIAVKDRKVGYTETSSVEDKTLGDTWIKNGQNTAFYGTFSL
jgi:hypothetical protein